MNLSLVTPISSPPAVLRLVVPGGMFLPWRADPVTTCLRRTDFSFSLSARRALRASAGT